MDIQISSNFERLLFDLAGRRAGRVRRLMADLAGKGSFRLDPGEHEALASAFAAERVSEAETRRTIARLHGETGLVVDPHTAVGLAAARACDPGDGVAMVTLATAHPAKFPEVVEKAVGAPVPQPARLAALMERKERYTVLADDYESLAAHILARSRAVRERA